MSSYQNRNQSRPRSRISLDRRMDKWIRTGKQVVDGVAGNRPGQRRVWQDKSTGANFDKVGRWMEEKIDWFFEDDEDWFENDDLEGDPIEETTINSKRPLGAISLRVPKALPPRIEEKRNNIDEINEWPDDQSFKLNKWERKDNWTTQNGYISNDSRQDEQISRRRNLPRSSRRKY